MKAPSTPSRLSPVALYYAPSPCSLAVHIALRELELPFQATVVHLATHTTADGANYYDISPRGYVPLLELAYGHGCSELAPLRLWTWPVREPNTHYRWRLAARPLLQALPRAAIAGNDALQGW